MNQIHSSTCATQMPQANKIVTAVTKRPPQRSTTQAIFVYSCIAVLKPLTVALNAITWARPTWTQWPRMVLLLPPLPPLPRPPWWLWHEFGPSYRRKTRNLMVGALAFGVDQKKREGKVNNFVPPNFAEIEVWRSTLMRRLCQSTTTGLDLG